MKRTVVILLVLLMGLLTACAVPPKTEANVTDPDAMNATAVRQTEADTKTDWAQGLTEQQEVETEIENAVSADTLDRCSRMLRSCLKSTKRRSWTARKRKPQS